MSLVCFHILYLHRWLQSGLFCHLDPSAPPSQQETAKKREYENMLWSYNILWVNPKVYTEELEIDWTRFSFDDLTDLHFIFLHFHDSNCFYLVFSHNYLKWIIWRSLLLCPVPSSDPTLTYLGIATIFSLPAHLVASTAWKVFRSFSKIKLFKQTLIFDFGSKDKRSFNLR